MRPLLTAACVAIAALPVRAGEPEARSSEALVTAEQAWATPGFRLELSVGYEVLLALDPAPLALAVAPALHLGWRLDADLGLAATLRYSATHGGLSGLRASATGELVWHVNDELELTAGLGYAATLLNHPDPPPIPYANLEDAARTGREPELPTFGACDGHGLAALVRAGYLWRVGHLFATGPMIQVDGQWTRCFDDDYVVYEPEDLLFLERDEVPSDWSAVEYHQWWQHFTVGVSWVFAWR